MNCITYGGLYQWNEAMQYNTRIGIRGICPIGWHIATMSEYQTLGTAASSDGNALKAIGQGAGAGAGTNTSEFSAMLSGIRYYNAYFNYLGGYTSLWSSTEYDATIAKYITLTSFNSNIMYEQWEKGNGFCVRCVRNLETSSVLSKGSREGAIKIVATSELPPSPPGENFSSTKQQIPTQYSLEQNYPNPFNPNTTIEYQVPTRSHVSIKVFDVLGREVATLVNGVEEPGYKSMNFNANGLESGMYFYRLHAGTFTDTKKLVLLR